MTTVRHFSLSFSFFIFHSLIHTCTYAFSASLFFIPFILNYTPLNAFLNIYDDHYKVALHTLHRRSRKDTTDRIYRLPQVHKYQLSFMAVTIFRSTYLESIADVGCHLTLYNVRVTPFLSIFSFFLYKEMRRFTHQNVRVVLKIFFLA